MTKNRKYDVLTLLATPCLVLTLLSGGVSASAQFGSASVVGYVKDPSGAVVQDVSVTLRNVSTGVSQTGHTDKEGKYEFDSVPIGNYLISTALANFQASKTEVFNLSTDARQRVDVNIKPGSVNEVVEVTSAAQLLDTETSSRSEVIGQKEVENLPLNGRSYADLVLLTPGVRKSMLENQTASSREAAFNINGQRSAFNEFLIDGLENSNYGTSNQGFEDENIAPSPDAVSEFRVESNNYAAEYGRMPGAVINVSTRSGTNQFHGAVWDYIRNTDLNAFGPIQTATGNKPGLIRNQFGATTGGPILHDKLFFFADYEGVRQIFTYQQAAVTLPDSEQRAGQFLLHRVDGTTSPVPLYNPLTATAYTTGNIAPASTPFALAVLAALPANNVTGSNGTTSPTYNNITNNYSNAPRGTINDDKGDIRVDQSFAKWKIFGRYSEHRAAIFDPPTVGGPAGGNANSNVNIQNRQIVGGATWIISQNRLLDFRFGYTRNIGAKTPYTQGQTSLLTQYGITDGLPTDPSLVRSLNAQSISGFTQLGNQSSSPQYQNPTIYNPKINYTLVHGNQSLKFGYEQQIIHTTVNDFNPSYGQDNYASRYAAGPSGLFPTCSGTVTTACIPTDTAAGNTASTQIQEAQEVADFLFGNRSSYSLTNYTVVQLRQRYFAGYFQDDLKVTPSLSVNVGLRYEIMTPQFEANNRLANFNPATNTLTPASNGSLYNRTLVHLPTKNIAPRFGFSKSVDAKTDVRGGYGLVYVQFNRAGGENNLTYNGPDVVNATVNNNNSIYPTPTSLCTTDSQVQTLCFRQTQQGYSNILTSPAYFNPLNVTSRYVDPNFKTGYVQSYFLGIQRQLPGSLLFDISYVGNKATHLQILADYNQANPCLAAVASTCGNYQSRRPVPTFGDVEIAYGSGIANYNSLQVKFEKRAGALYVLNSFTYSRAFDLASGHLEMNNGDTSRVNYANPRNDYGPSSYDQPIDNTTSIVYDLPYGHGRQFGAHSSRVANALLGGWQATVINTITSGLPFNMIYSSSSSSTTTSQLNGTGGATIGELFASDLDNLRPQHIAGSPLKGTNVTVLPTSNINKVNKSRGLSGYLPGAGQYTSYDYPSYTRYGNVSAWGNVSRNSLRSFAYYNTDVGLHKQFPVVTERVKLDLRAETFNVLNHTNWQAPDTNISDGTSFGTITTAFPSRQLQFAAKVIF
ncbi:outer membrane beta-barrel protein [Granulicella tundricola]|uniref:TonB-dependent receptor plug n=1 Tax=Granulicella tundricola (strain ATCC BAA-1859 / DSM 23138 / MP5ACTX9) TaxID=1198114 RepID=E8X5W6_GRATM|nr:carboxypeptidase regulatory-like domain-containing protein [Granulicella tundricola]ADW70850.1 TonB-dependent receptor plug [Granulicella tundricola MP5ACTX9]